MRDVKFALLLAAPFCAAVVLLGFILFRIGTWNAARWIGLVIAAPSAVFLLITRYPLGPSFSVTPQARELVTHGMYCKIRNPMYVFSALLLAGFALALQIRYLFLLYAILIPIQIIRARKEAKVLEAKFGDTYREYRNKTWF
jgi:protein-S-isoprenylcysteine O-methyltransferase Ste14